MKVPNFISRDPLGLGGSDVNLYAYVFNNPVNWIDPLGLEVFGTYDLNTGILAITDADTGQMTVKEDK